MLIDFGVEFGFGVIIVELLELDIGEVLLIVICDVLSDGCFCDVVCMLGYWYRIDGFVICGD